MSRYRYPYIPDRREWKELVDSEFYFEARNRGRRLTDNEKKAVVRSIKRDLELSEDKVGLGRRSCRNSRLSTAIGEAYGLHPPQKNLGGYSDFDEMYLDFIDYVHHHFDDLNVLVPNHHRKNLKNLLLRITCDQLRSLVEKLFRKVPDLQDHKNLRPLWDDYKMLCSLSIYVIFYMISLGYISLVMQVDPIKYVVYDFKFGISSYDLNYVYENFGNVFSGFIKMFDHIHRDDRDPSTQILVLLQIPQQSVFSERVVSDRKKEIIDGAQKCRNSMVNSLVNYGLDESVIKRILILDPYIDLVNSSDIDKVIYYSEFLKTRNIEGELNTLCNNRRLSKQPRSLGFKGHASTLVNYLEINWVDLGLYDGKNCTLKHSFVTFLVPELDHLDDLPQSSHSSSVSFGAPILQSPEGVSFVFNNTRSDHVLSSSPVFGARPPAAVFSSGIQKVNVEGFGVDRKIRRSRLGG